LDNNNFLQQVYIQLTEVSEQKTSVNINQHRIPICINNWNQQNQALKRTKTLAPLCCGNTALA